MASRYDAIFEAIYNGREISQDLLDSLNGEQRPYNAELDALLAESLSDGVTSEQYERMVRAREAQQSATIW